MAPNLCVSCFKELAESENVFTCSKQHLFCVACGKSMHLQCECYESLQLLTLKNVEENPSGVECLGNLLKIWNCNWTGSKKEFHEHFVQAHNNIEMFSQFQVSSVPFRSDQLLSAMTLVRAHDSTFIFYYHTNPEVKMIYFLIFLLDKEDQPAPESFLYEFMVKSPNENHCKIKFVEKCFVLDDDIIRLRDTESCAAITFQSIEKHLFEEHIHFSFLIKHNRNDPRDPNLKCGASCNVAPKQTTKAKPPASTAKNKGSLRGSTLSKNQSIPDVKLSGGGVLKKEVTFAEVEEIKGTKSQPPEYSSINKTNNNTQFTSPAHCTAAMKRNDEELIQQTTKADECYNLPNVLCQSYKSPDQKTYKQKYPTSSLSKPILRR